MFAYIGFGTPISAGSCATATNWNVSQRRGFTWASGEMRCHVLQSLLPAEFAEFRLRQQRRRHHHRFRLARRVAITPAASTCSLRMDQSISSRTASISAPGEVCLREMAAKCWAITNFISERFAFIGEPPTLVGGGHRILPPLTWEARFHWSCQYGQRACGRFCSRPARVRGTA